MTAAPGAVSRQISLPFTDALKISYRSLKIRFWRSLITIGGIFFGIAFLMSILTSAAIGKKLLHEGSPQVQAILEQQGTNIGAHQYWLVSLSLLVCVVGITNAMLMSVTERYKEIGTMKCLGALDRFILELFLLESAFQGLVGSAGGVVVGALFMVLASMANYGLQVIVHFPALPVLRSAALATVAGVALSAMGAVYPAYRAARMQAAEAMRSEV